MKNAGKSQMAAGLMRQLAGDTVEVHSAGTAPGTAVNDLSAQALLEVGGVDISSEQPTRVDYELARDVDFVVTLGREARLDPLPGNPGRELGHRRALRTRRRRLERMRLVRDDIAARVRRLYSTLVDATPP